ncbi:hypothetical protein [Ligilactobacillus murinus]|uniref:hypothetical protein n=1 Tax=Ligilactobacillus murinus TaxID=1622 RepID=UPI000B5C803D|nr:hypothetical protein [Ligilactobacillus murinus]
MNGNYGVTRDIYAKMKVAGFVMWKLVAVALSLVIAFFAMSKIFPNEGIWRYMQLVYVGLTPTWVGSHVGRLFIDAGSGWKNNVRLSVYSVGKKEAVLP